MLVKLIENSLGNSEGFRLSLKKSKLLLLAKSLGVRCPPTVGISSQEIDCQLYTVTYPILIKGDGSCGGKLVQIVEDPAQARRAIFEFQLPSNWPMLLRVLIAKFLPASIVKMIPSDPSDICMQDFVSGYPANRAVACWKGEVLAGTSVRVRETVYPFGPAALVESINSPEMAEVAKVLVKRLKLSGLIGFDFMLNSANRAWFIEMNPRVTPVSYLHCSEGPNLSDALFSKVAGIGLRFQHSKVPQRLFALFPKSWNAVLIANSYHQTMMTFLGRNQN